MHLNKKDKAKLNEAFESDSVEGKFSSEAPLNLNVLLKEKTFEKLKKKAHKKQVSEGSLAAKLIKKGLNS